MLPLQSVLNEFPYPVAFPYALVFDGKQAGSVRRWALCFTEYQLLRMVSLPLVGQYLREEITTTSPESIQAVNRAITAIRSPCFKDWISLLFVLDQHLPRVGIQPVFPELTAALASLKVPAERPVGLSGRTLLDPLQAIQALRNATAHGGLPNEREAEQQVEAYLPVLHQVLDAFGFLAETEVRVRLGAVDPVMQTARVRVLRGSEPPDAREETTSEAEREAFEESPTILRTAEGRVFPLYPLLHTAAESEPLFLYDGHYGIRVQTQQGQEERRYIYYLGTYRRAEDEGESCERLHGLLDRRRISFFLNKDQTAPWTIADSARDYSRRTLEDLRGTKYFPECYLPFAELERKFSGFLTIPSPARWVTDTQRRRYVNGFILVGLAGAGKTAFLARQVEGLLKTLDGDSRESVNLVLFLRGNGIALRPEGMSLFKDVAEKLGVAAGAAKNKASSEGGFSSFRELLEHLHVRWKQDRVEGRRLVLVIDALNEAPYAAQVVGQALELVGDAACFPWCKVIISTRQEWLSIWSGKQGAQEQNPLEEMRSYLYVAEASERTTGQLPPPVVMLEPFTTEQAAGVYAHYQTNRRKGAADGYAIPACSTAWAMLPDGTGDLLSKPLYLHLFMEAFDGRDAPPVSTVPTLFERYVARVLQGRAGMQDAVDTVIGHLLENVGRPSADLGDDDSNAIRLKWAEGRTPEEARLLLSPVEALVHEGILTKRVREEGGGYRFIFQQVAEYLIYRRLDTLRGSEDEATYWQRIAVREEVFPEYAGAFGILLRHWSDREAYGAITALVENSAAAETWLGDAATSLLVELGRREYTVGEGSPVVRRAVTKLAEHGGSHCYAVLFAAGMEIHHTRFASSALPCYVGAQRICERQLDNRPETLSTGDVAYWLAKVLRNLGFLLRDTGHMEDAAAVFRRSVTINEVLHAGKPENVEVACALSAALISLGGLLTDAGLVEDAEALYRRSAAIVDALHTNNPGNNELADGLASVLNSLGALLMNTGRVEEAESAYRRSVELREALHEGNPENIEFTHGFGMVLSNLGLLLKDAGRLGEAEAAFQRAVMLHEALHVGNPENLAFADGLASVLSNLGLLMRDAGRMTESKEAYRRAVELHEVLHAENPENVAFAAGLGGALMNLGLLLEDAGQVEETEAAYCRAVEIHEVLHANSPENIAFADILALALNNLGSLLSDVGRPEEAEAAYRRAVEIRDELLVSNPENLTFANRLASVLNNLANLLSNAGQLVDAEPLYRRSVEIGDELLVSNPENVEVAHGQGVHLKNLGNLLSDLGQMEEAEAAYRRAVEIQDDLHASSSENVEVADGLGSALIGLGILLAKARRLVDAEAAFRRALEISEVLHAGNPENVKFAYGLTVELNNLGALLSDVGELEEAEAAYRRSVEIHDVVHASNPANIRFADGLGAALNNLGSLLAKAGRMGEAEPVFQRALAIREALYASDPESIELADGLGSALNNMGLMLNNAGRLKDAELNCRRSVEIYEALHAANPTNVECAKGLGLVLGTLGSLLKNSGRTEEATAAQRRAVEVLAGLEGCNPAVINIAYRFGLALNKLGQSLKGPRGWKR